MRSLAKVLDSLEEIASTSKRTEKEKLLKEYAKHLWFERTIVYALHPYKQFNLNRVAFVSHESNNHKDVKSIFDYLDFLSEKRGCTNKEFLTLSKLSSADRETVEVVHRILNKDLRCGVSLKTARKFFPEIPLHEVALAISDKDEFFKVAGCSSSNMRNINYSVKMNGVRVWAVIDKEGTEPRYISRNGKPFENFKVFNPDISRLAKLFTEKVKRVYPVIFDGEVSSIDKSFQKGMTQFRRLNDVDPSIFRFDSFDLPEMNLPFIERYSILESLFMEVNSRRTKLLQHTFFTDESCTYEYLLKILQDHIDKGEEGLMLKTNHGPYERKRSKHWCKMVEIYTADLPVLGFNYGKGKYKDLLGSLSCNFEGQTVDVGSGFSDDERKEFLENTPKMIEVEYKNITNDGKLFHPTFVRVREDK